MFLINFFSLLFLCCEFIVVFFSGECPIPPEFFSPSGRRIIWVPEIPKPDYKVVYESLDEAIDMYRRYGTEAGFDVRKASVKIHKKTRLITHKKMLCSRQGEIENLYVDTTDEKKNKIYRYSNIKRTGCQAFAKFKRLGNSDQFQLYGFEEKHNHPLVTAEFRHFMKVNRQLDNSTRSFLEKMSRINIGPAKAYRIMQELKGSYNIEGGTVVDYKNETRKVNCFMEKEDAQMVVDKYVRLKKEDPNLTFEFISDKGSLSSLFWADEAAKANYKEFGDIVSFDATFRTNK